jgi:tetratricopeptide (TPR) repeat protein
VPAGLAAPLDIEIKLQYRKFTRYFTTYSLGAGAPELPITTIASDHVTFPISGMPREAAEQASPVNVWERWNDYGIGLLLEGTTGSEKGELRQAADAFTEVERHGRPDGALNLARVYFKEGRLDDAASALRRASAAGAPPWTVAWLSGLVNKENGYLDQAIEDFERVLATGPSEVGARRFDFSADYEVINELGQALFERSKLERGPSAEVGRRQYLEKAAAQFERTLQLDAENVTAHYVLSLIYAQLGDSRQAADHSVLHARYKPDDNARDRAIATHRLANPAANHAAQSIVIYPLR